MTDAAHRTIRVDLGPRSYDVRIGPGAMDAVGQAVAALDPTQALVLSESTVAPLYADRVLASLASAGVSARLIEPFAAGEQHKTLDTVVALLDGVLGGEPAVDRGAVVVALGGGVAGDMAGFVAAVALRGLRWVQTPTTLLADVDASVGGKTGVDHASGKNLIGAFHQPAGVIADVDALRSLPKAQLSNGLAECVKHAIIRDADLLAFLETHAEALLAGQDGALAFPADVMTDLLARNVAIKAAVVAADEREASVRAHLNYGHTVGHAIECHIGYDRLLHGQAIAYGTIVADRIAVNRGLLAPAIAARTRAVLGKLGLSTRLPAEAAPIDAIGPIMLHDKKARAGKVRFVLARALGDVDLYDDVTRDEVAAALPALAEDN